jgi:uncharacterized protein DUF5678
MPRPERVRLTTLYLRGMPTRVVREAKAAAARRGATLAALVSDTLARALEQGDDGRSGGDIDDGMRWYDENRARLLPRYRGQYVAIVDRAVLDHDRDFEALARRVFARIGVRPVFMPRVQAGEARAKLRSPRLARR